MKVTSLVAVAASFTAVEALSVPRAQQGKDSFLPDQAFQSTVDEAPNDDVVTLDDNAAQAPQASVTTITTMVAVTAPVNPVTMTVFNQQANITTVFVAVGVYDAEATAATAQNTNKAVAEPATVTYVPQDVGPQGVAPPAAVGPNKATIAVQTPAAVAFNCDDRAWFVSDDTMYSLDLYTGNPEFLRSGLADHGGISAIGFNPLDNFIYGISEKAEPAQLVRFSGSGDSVSMFNLPFTSAKYSAGDIDQKGYFWATATGQEWIKVDLIPGSSTYGRIVGHGPGTVPPAQPFDWAYVPGAGNALWSVGHNDQGTVLMRWDMDQHYWSSVGEYGRLAGDSEWRSTYAGANGELFASEATTGEIWRFHIDGTSPRMVSRGPRGIYNNGARCLRSGVFAQ